MAIPPPPPNTSIHHNLSSVRNSMKISFHSTTKYNNFTLTYLEFSYVPIIKKKTKKPSNFTRSQSSSIFINSSKW